MIVFKSNIATNGVPSEKSSSLLFVNESFKLIIEVDTMLTLKFLNSNKLVKLLEYDFGEQERWLVEEISLITKLDKQDILNNDDYVFLLSSLQYSLNNSLLNEVETEVHNRLKNNSGEVIDVDQIFSGVQEKIIKKIIELNLFKEN